MYNLIGIDTAKRFMKIDSNQYDDILNDLLSMTSRSIEQYCSKRFVTRQFTEYQNGNGKKFLLTNFYPIYSVTSVHDDPDHDYGSNYLLSSDDYSIFYDTGEIRLTESEYKFMKGQQNVKIIYTAGYSRFDVVDESNNYIDVTEAGSSYATEISANTLTNTKYVGYSAEALATAVAAALNANVNLAYTYTVTYNHKSQKFTIGSSSAFTINWLTGTNTKKSIGYLMGFTNSDTGSATSHESDFTVTGIPNDLQLAACQVLAYHYDDSKEGRGLTRTSKQVFPAGQGTEEFVQDLPRTTRRILDSYRRALV